MVSDKEMAVMFGGSRVPFMMSSPESITTYVPIKGSTDVGISVMTANSPTPGTSARPFKLKD